ncbi:MAG: hypothetical protein ACFFCW_14345 [Candidatus Hodarchaeota archaeon]
MFVEKLVKIYGRFERFGPCEIIFRKDREFDTYLTEIRIIRKGELHALTIAISQVALCYSQNVDEYFDNWVDKTEAMFERAFNK